MGLLEEDRRRSSGEDPHLDRYRRERAPLPDDLVDHLPRLFLQVGLDLGGHALRRHAPFSDPVLDRGEDPDGPQYRTSACSVLQREPQCRARSRAPVHAHDHRCRPFMAIPRVPPGSAEPLCRPRTLPRRPRARDGRTTR
jgi:hypothetical protein